MIKNKIEKRDYQTKCLKAVKKHREAGNKKALIQLATGLGKTFLAVQDVKSFRETSRNKNIKVLFTAHILDILEEAKDEFARQLPNLEVDFLTIQSLFSNLDEYSSKYYDYIIFDEAHHSKATTHEQVVKHFKPKFKLALTATPHRADGLDIEELFGEPIFSMNLPDGLAGGYLAKLDYQVVFDQSIREAIMKDFNPTSILELRKLIGVRPRNKEIVKNILEEKARLRLSKAQTIVFCQSIEHANEIASLLKGKSYHSALPKAEKDAIFNNFRLGLLETICTVDMFNEGVNIPNARLLVFLRSTASRTIFLQQLGRGLRKTSSKQKVSVLDFAANIERLENIEELTQQVSRAERESGGFVDGSDSKFVNYSFVFSKHVMEVISKLHILTETIPPDFISFAELSSKYSIDVSSLGDMCARHNIKVKKFSKDDTSGKGNGNRIRAISLHDFRKLKSKYVVFFAPEYIKDQGIYTTEDISKMFNCDVRTVRSRLNKLGLNKSFSRSGKGRSFITIDSEQLEVYKKAYPTMELDPKGYTSLHKSMKIIGNKYDVSHQSVRKLTRDYVDSLDLPVFNFSVNYGVRSYDQCKAFTDRQLREVEKVFLDNYIEKFASKTTSDNRRKSKPGAKPVKCRSGEIVYESKCELNRKLGLSSHLGTFSTAKEANEAYVGARREYIKWKLGV